MWEERSKAHRQYAVVVTEAAKIRIDLRNVGG
jgi:hypothetical protein